MSTVSLNQASKLIFSSLSTVALTLGMTACNDMSAPSPRASAPLAPVTGQVYQKIFADGSTLGDADNWSCIKDKTTGLVWERKQPEGMSSYTLRQSNSTYTWFSGDVGFAGNDSGDMTKSGTCASVSASCDAESYVDAVNDIGLCGKNDWRLPNKEELLSIVDRVNGINTSYFDNVATASYWTANSEAQETLQPNAWVVDFEIGGVAVNSLPKTSSNAIRLVRGEWAREADSSCDQILYQQKPDSIYTEAADADGIALNATDAFIDKQTGLMWQTSEQAAATWASVQVGNAYGYSDWRLPTINELHSLLDTGCALPVTNENYITSFKSVWSSTEDVANNQAVLAVNFSTGAEVLLDKTTASPYLLVRTAY